MSDAEPMTPLNPDHDGEQRTDDDDVGVPIDPTDPLKREGDDDMPGADPTPPAVPPD